MIKKLILILIFAIYSSGLMGQYLDNKIDFGIGGSLHLPLNLKTISKNDNFLYPSLFGNYTSGNGIQSFLDYHAAEFLRLGIQLETTKYSSWSGDQDIFIIQDPILSLTSLSLSGLFLPVNVLQFSNPAIKWGYYLAPVLTYEKLEWENSVPENNNQLHYSHNTINVGLKTGVSLFYEISNYFGLKMDTYYHISKTDTLYYLDHSFHSLNVSFSIYFKLLKNKYFRYD